MTSIGLPELIVLLFLAAVIGLGVLPVVLMTRKKPGKLCAHCGKYSQPDSRFCPHCGQPFA